MMVSDGSLKLLQGLCVFERPTHHYQFRTSIVVLRDHGIYQMHENGCDSLVNNLKITLN